MASTAGGHLPTSSRTGYSGNGTSLLAIFEGKGHSKGDVGLAALDLRLTKLRLCQFHDSLEYAQVIAKINVFNPFEVLMPATACEQTGEPSRLYLQIQQEFPHVAILPLQRKLFNDSIGIQKLEYIVHPDYSSVLYTVSQKYLALGSVAALLKYVENFQNAIFPGSILQVEFQPAEKTMMIDYTTSQHLELLRNNITLKPNPSLYGVLNYCRTPGGSRCLRANILQPMYDLEMITRRLDCIQELRNNPVLQYDLLSALNQIPQDLEHVIATLIHIPKVESPRILEQRINYIIFLKQTLSCIPMFASALANGEHLFFLQARLEFLSDKFANMQDRIQLVLNEDTRFSKGGVAMRMQRSFAINSEVNPLLDLARSAFLELQDDTTRYVADLSVTHQMNLRLMENSSRGYYIQLALPARALELVTFPPEFLNLVRKNNSVTFTTQELLVSQQRMTKVLEEIQRISSIVVTELLTDIRREIGYLYRLSDAICELDVLYALTTYSMACGQTIVRPWFSPNFTAIKEGRHPVLQTVLTSRPVPNDLFMSADSNFAMITGPNMSGKTTLLKQMATLQVLAQIGSFVPAESATFRLSNQIFSRLGNSDKLDEHASSFILEIREMLYILNNMTPKALVIIDELGRSTSIEEATGICWGLIEALLKKKGFVLFSTHFLFLTKLSLMYPNMINYQMETMEVINSTENDPERFTTPENMSLAKTLFQTKLSYTHSVRRGVTGIVNYGLKLAKASSVPESVIQRAATLAEEIQKSRTTVTGLTTRGYTADSPAVEESSRKRAQYQLASHLFMVASNGVFERSSRWEVISYLQHLQEECIDLFVDNFNGPEGDDPEDKNETMT